MALSNKNYIIKKHQIGLFLDIDKTGSNPDYQRIKKSTDFTVSFNPETESREYIADEMPTTTLLYYKPSLEQPITMFADDPIFEYIQDKVYNLDPSSTSSTVIIAWMHEEVEDGKFAAWRVPVDLIMQNFDAVASTITFTIEFGGTIEQGTVSKTGDKVEFSPTSTMSLINEALVKKVASR